MVSRVFKRALLLSVFFIFLCMSIGAQAATVTQTAAHVSGESWNTTTKWSDGMLPAITNSYVNSGFSTRTPGVSNPTFGGYSLTLTNGGTLNLKHGGTATISNLIVDAGCKIANGVGSSSISGDIISITGSGTVTFDSQIDSRTTTIDSMVTADPGIDTISVQMLQSPWAEPSNKGGFVMNNASNSFAGTWDVFKGRLKGVGFGTGNFKVGPLGYLDFDAGYTNDSAYLSITNGGKMLLDQDLYFLSANLYGVELEIGTKLTGAELKAHPTYGAAFDTNSLDSAILRLVPHKATAIMIE